MKNLKKLPPNIGAGTPGSAPSLTQSGNPPGCDEPMNRYEMNPVCPPEPCPPTPCPPDPDCVKVYAVGPRGPQGPAGAPGAAGSPGPAGPQGNPGSPGPAGPSGPAGTPGNDGAPGAPGRDGASVSLLGTYNTLAELQAAHPTGAPGDAYLVNGGMYVWDASSSAWKLLGSVIGPQGVQGLQGVPGAAGAAGLIGPQGPAGAMGAQGPVGPAGAAGAQGPAGPQGPAGTPGAQGPQGIPGAAGTQGPAGANGIDGTGVNILGSYATLAALVAAHPTGTAGDAYLIADDLYVWSTTSGTPSWTNVGTIRGPQGQQGAQGFTGTPGTQGPPGPKGDIGIQGPTGAQGQKGDPGPKGDAGIQGPRGLQGVPGAAGAPGAAGPQGVQGLQGMPGATGRDGTSVTLEGSYDTLEDLEAAHPRGTAGDAYLVGGGIYIWDASSDVWSYLGDLRGPAGAKGDAGPAGASGATGAPGPSGPAGPAGSQGPQGQPGPIGPAGAVGPPGPQGPAGPSGNDLTSLIPFASGRAPLVSSDSNGASSSVAAVGFGGSGTAIPISPGGTVTPTAESQIAFSLPFDAVIDRVYASFSNVAVFTVPTGLSAFPYVQLYSAAPGSGTFTPLAGTKTLPVAGFSGQVPALTALFASRSNMGITLPAGTRILIGGQMELAGSPLLALGYYFFFTGAIAVRQV